jgi:hypothetical protein
LIGHKLKLLWFKSTWLTFKAHFMWSSRKRGIFLCTCSWSLGNHSLDPTLHTGLMLFVYFMVYEQWAMFQLSGDCQLYRWQGCKFRPMLSTCGFSQWEFFYVPKLLRYGTSGGLIQRTGSHVPQRDSNPWSRSLRRCSNRCATRVTGWMLKSHDQRSNWR